VTVGVRQGEEALLFLKKKNRAAGRQKDFRPCGLWHPQGQRPQDQKFFWLLFFQKK
jgi:hypothetical protein